MPARSNLETSCLAAGVALCMGLGTATSTLAQTTDVPDGWNRFAYSRSSGVEVLVLAREGKWCRQALELKLVAESPSTLKAEALRPFFKTLSGLLTKDCPNARYFTIIGVQRGQEKEIFRAEAASANDWYIFDLGKQVTPKLGAAQTAEPPDLSPQEKQRLDELLTLARAARDAKSKPGRNLKVQKLLKKLGLYDGSLNGQNDKATSSAIAKFKESYGLPANGEIDDAFLAALNDPNALVQN